MTVRNRPFGFLFLLTRWLAIAAFSASTCVHAALTYSWTGAQGNNWGNPNNWTPIGTPENGDALAFPAGPTVLSMTNDLPGLRVTGLYFNGGGYSVAGNPLTITESIASLGGTYTLDLPIDFQANTVTLSYAYVTLGPNALISGTGTLQNFAITAVNGAHPFSGLINNSGQLRMNGGSFGNATIANYGAVTGRGTVGPVTNYYLFGPATGQGCCSTGTGPGILATGNLASPNASLYFDIDGAAAGSGYDRVDVTGTVNLGTSSLSVAIGGGFVPTPGQQFVLIANDGTDAISGTFNGLPEGATFTVGSVEFSISYAGGDGNDVVLTCLSVPRKWTGAAGPSWSQPANWSPAGVPATGDTLQFPGGVPTTIMVNDLPAGLLLKSLFFSAGDYELSGNAIGITGTIVPSNSNLLDLPIDISGTVSIEYGNITLGPNSNITGAGVLNTSAIIGVRGVHGFAGTINNSGQLRMLGGSLHSATIANYGAVAGSGDVGTVTNYYLFGPALPHACCATGSGPGVIATGNLASPNAGLYFDLDGAAPGSGYDQVIVTGTVNLSSASLSVAMSGAFSATPGQQFLLISNDGTEAVQGVFNGLPEGASITVNSIDFTISYVGGDGNDVVLTCVSAPRTWTGIAGSAWSQPANWSPPGIPVAGDTLQFPGGVPTTVMVNDLPAGLALKTLAFTSGGYQLGGNAITLSKSLVPSNFNLIDLPIGVPGTLTMEYGYVTFGPNSNISGAGTLSTSAIITVQGNNTFVGAISNSGQLRMQGGSFAGATIANYGAVAGNGSVGAVTNFYLLGPAAGQGCCATGTGPGLLRTGNLASPNAALYFDIDGPGLSTGYDSIEVAGSVNLGSAQLSLAMSPSFVPSKGQVYRIITNDGADPVIGTFNSLPEGHEITLNGYQLKLSYQGGDGNDVTLTAINGKEATTVTLTSSSTTASAGQPVTFTVTITGAFGTPTGTVTVRDGQTILGTANLVNGVATFVVPSLLPGSHAISAEYTGDGVYGGSASQVFTQNVSAFTSTIGIASSSNPSTLGSAVTFTATVSSPNGVPIGGVVFKDGPSIIGIGVLSGGVASTTTSLLSLGDHVVTADYFGDSSFGSSTATLTQTVEVNLAVPSAPTIGSAAAGNGEAWVSFSSPDNDGGSPISRYTATSDPGGITASGAGSPIHVTGLTNGITYTFRVTATNGIGTSGQSVASNAVSPSGAIVGGGTPLTGVLQIVAGAWHTCVLTGSGGVKCWGANNFGQLGDGSFTDRTTPVDVVGLASGVVAIGSTGHSVCAIDTAGGLKCWGYNGGGGLGIGESGNRNVPTQVVGLTSGVAVAAPGNGHTCAMMATGAVKCWGHGQNGRLGIPYFFDDQYTPADVVLPAPAISLAAGAGATCAVLSNGGVKCWGENGNGTVGDGTNADSDHPVDVVGLTSGAIGVSIGVHQACARLANDTLRCWGGNAFGQLGDGTFVSKNTPVTINGDFEGDVDAATGWYHTCILSDTGGVKCWGRNTEYQLGDGTLVNRASPVDVLGLGNDVVEVAAGYQHTCVIAGGGRVLCWGANDLGQLGDGTTTPRPLPGDISAPPAKQPQSITFDPPASPVAVGSSFNVSGTASSGLTVSFTVAGPCSISGGTVTMTSGSGTCTLTATQGGNANYAPAPPVTRTVAAARIAQSIGFGPLADRTYGEAGFTLGATSSSGLAVAYASLTPGSCAVAGNAVTLGNAGTCTIRASQEGDANHLAAASVEQSFTVLLRAVTATADALSKFVGLADPALTFTVTSGSLPAGDAFTGTLIRAPGEAVGSYAISANTLALSSNYNLTFVGASFTVAGLTLAGPDPVALGSAATVTATFPDTGSSATPTCTINWRDPALATTSAGTATKVGTNWVCTFIRTYSAVGVYAPTVTVVDADLGTISGVHEFVVVYDASAGFVTGGGWITSPPGAYMAGPTLTGKATFGFVSKYQNGQSTPTGETQFQFKAGDFSFKSVAYEWLVISGAKARYRGTGQVNGAGSFGFELTAIDGDSQGGSKGPDKFRLQVWDANRGNAMVYDNQVGSAAGDDPTTVLGGGSIQIHR